VKGNVGSLRIWSVRLHALLSPWRPITESMAGKALAEKDHASAGRWLKGAGDSVDEAAAWTGQSPSGAQAEAWDQMHAVQAKIRAATNWSCDEAKRGVGYLGERIQ
jgi:hypothetical protein